MLSIHPVTEMRLQTHPGAGVFCYSKQYVMRCYLCDYLSDLTLAFIAFLKTSQTELLMQMKNQCNNLI